MKKSCYIIIYSDNGFLELILKLLDQTMDEIIIVDDFMGVRSIVKESLTRRGYEVLEANNAKLETSYCHLKTAIDMCDTLIQEYKFDNGLPLEIGLDFNHYMIDDGTSVDLPASLQSKGLNIGTKFPMPYVDSEEWFVGVDLGVYFQTAKSHALHSSAFRSKNKIYGIYKKILCQLYCNHLKVPGYLAGPKSGNVFRYN